MRRGLSLLLLSRGPLVFFLFSIFFLFLLSPVDTDLGWQLRYGSYFLKHGRPLMKNTLSVLMAGYRWPNSYTLYQPLVALVYRWFSFWGLSALNGFILALSFYFIYLLLGKGLLRTTAVLVLFAVGGWSALEYGLRGQIMSILFLSALLFVLFKVGAHFKRLASLVLIFALWANFHGGFILGVLLVLLWSALQVVSVFLKEETFAVTDWLVPLSTSFLALVSPLFNPYGVGVYAYVLQHIRTPMRQLIAEWVPPVGAQRLLILFLVLCYALIIIYKRRVAKDIFWVLAVILTAYLALSARRNLPLFFLIQGISLCWMLPEVRLAGTAGTRRRELDILMIIPISLILFYALLIQLPRTVRLNSNWESYCSEGIARMPRKAVAFMRREGIRGNIFNFYRWGGFLAWQLPENKIFVDGRMPAWPHPSGKSPYTIHLEVLQAQRGYQNILDRYNISWILIPGGTFLDRALAGGRNRAWREIYRDEVAVLYGRANK